MAENFVGNTACLVCSRLFAGPEESCFGTSSLTIWDANNHKHPPANYLAMKNAFSETQVR